MALKIWVRVRHIDKINISAVNAMYVVHNKINLGIL